MQTFTVLDRAKRQFRSISGLLLIYMLLTIPLSFGLVGLFQYMLYPLFGYDLAVSVYQVLAYLFSSLLTASVFLLAKSRLKCPLPSDLFRFSMDWKRLGKYIVLLLGAGFLCSIGVSILDEIWRMIFHTPVSGYDLDFTGNMLFDLFIVVDIAVIAPVFEELLFRGVILRTLDRYHRVFAIVVSSLLFATLHMNLVQGISTFFVGCIFAYASLKEDSMMVPIILHIVNNALSLMMSYWNLEILWTILIIGSIVGAIFLLVKNVGQIRDLMIKERCSYPYGTWFFKQWTTIVYLIVFILEAFFMA